MPSSSRLVASLLTSTLLLASASVRAQGAPPPGAPQPSPAASAPPPASAAPPPQAPLPQAPPPYVTPPPPQPAYPQQAYGQAAYPTQPYPPHAWRPPRASKGLMITGISIFGGSYLLAMLVGASLLDEDGDRERFDDDGLDCRYCADVAPYLFIPLAGPFVAMSQTPNDGGLLVLGMVELVGAALTIGGIVRYRNTKREAALSGYSLALPHDRSLTFDVGASRRATGPRMTLRF